MSEVRKGNLYQWKDERVICVEVRGPRAWVREIRDGAEWLADRKEVRADDLTPLPMRYHGGELP